MQVLLKKGEIMSSFLVFLLLFLASCGKDSYKEPIITSAQECLEREEAVAACVRLNHDTGTQEQVIDTCNRVYAEINKCYRIVYRSHITEE